MVSLSGAGGCVHSGNCRKRRGALAPALARPREDDSYELNAGHRRKRTCELAEMTTMSVVVRNIDRDAATIITVDSSLR